MFNFFNKPASPAPDPTPMPKVFSQPVTGGYVDDQGKWYPTRDEADLASAVRHMVNEAHDSRFMNGLGSYYFDAAGFECRLADPDTVNAMAIIARVRGGA